MPTTKHEHRVTKSSVELYQIRFSSGFAWADITIDAHGEAGRISIASDYGDWQNYWSHCGCPFKQFLGQIDCYYAANKFGASKWLDVDKTLKGFKRELLQYRREGWGTADEAREIFDQIKTLEQEATPESLSHDLRLHDELADFLCENGGPDFTYSIEPAFRQFWEELWPVMLAEFALEATPAKSQPA